MTVAAVIVAFNPDTEELQTNINAVGAQVEHVVLVDNSPTESVFNGVSEYIWFPENVGVGKGQNVGIAKAEELGAEQVLLLDQDSFLHAGGVEVLFNALVSANDVAAVGPVYRELNSGQLSGFFQLGMLGPKRVKGSSLSLGETVNTDFLISAGSLLKLRAFHEIGSMREDFFIDYIDTDWCIRAGITGYRLIGVGGELMDHRIGEAQKKIWVGGTQYLPEYSLARYGHNLRNLRVLIAESAAPIRWKVFLVWRFVCLALLHQFLGYKGSN